MYVVFIPVHYSLLQHELDSVHKVRVAFGNGLRKDIFEAVLKRFKIPRICEFFGATEGVSMLLNIANRPGAIGRVSPFLVCFYNRKYLAEYIC